MLPCPARQHIDTHRGVKLTQSPKVNKATELKTRCSPWYLQLMYQDWCILLHFPVTYTYNVTTNHSIEDK